MFCPVEGLWRTCLQGQCLQNKEWMLKASWEGGSQGTLWTKPFFTLWSIKSVVCKVALRVVG
jgi:hypothetical protein